MLLPDISDILSVHFERIPGVLRGSLLAHYPVLVSYILSFHIQFFLCKFDHLPIVLHQLVVNLIPYQMYRYRITRLEVPLRQLFVSFLSCIRCIDIALLVWKSLFVSYLSRSSLVSDVSISHYSPGSPSSSAICLVPLLYQMYRYRITRLEVPLRQLFVSFLSCIRCIDIALLVWKSLFVSYLSRSSLVSDVSISHYSSGSPSSSAICLVPLLYQMYRYCSTRLEVPLRQLFVSLLSCFS